MQRKQDPLEPGGSGSGYSIEVATLEGPPLVTPDKSLSSAGGS